MSPSARTNRTSGVVHQRRLLRGFVLTVLPSLSCGLANGTLMRAQVLRAVVQSSDVYAAEYRGAFVAMQYYGYLRRTPEQSGYEAWRKVFNEDPDNIRTMIDGFMNSTEHRLRFGQP
jgi:Domain of unknown function (DUF4214)